MASPERTCVATREKLPQADLVRLVLDPEGVLQVDYRARLGGRGAWVVPERAAVEAVEAKPALLGRSLRRRDADTRGLLDRVRAANTRAVLDALSLCARAGALVGGKDGVRSAIAGGALAVVLAEDASPRLAEDLRRRAAAALVVQVPLDRDALGVQVGKGPRAALAVRRSKPGRSLVRELHRMAALR